VRSFIYLDLHAALLQLGADLVTIFNDNTKVCGMAFLSVREKEAFSAVMRGCYTSYALAHEIGHNQVGSVINAHLVYLFSLTHSMNCHPNQLLI
jgi:hypothetical protein